jgi:hypothetical protein
MGKLENLRRNGHYSGKYAENPANPLGSFLSVGIQASALSQINLGVDRLEFAAGVVDLHLPIDAALGAVHIG